MSIEIKVNRIHRINDEEKNLKAFADIEINGSFLVKGIRVVKGKSGIFVGMPREKSKDNKWYETVRTLTPEVKEQLAAVVLSAYQGDEVIS
jgi:stage V sporulation protein G